MISPLTWIRTRVRDAVLAGIGDALVSLDGTDNATATLQLSALLAPVLPAPEDEAAPAPARRAV